MYSEQGNSLEDNESTSFWRRVEGKCSWGTINVSKVLKDMSAYIWMKYTSITGTLNSLSATNSKGNVTNILFLL